MTSPPTRPPASGPIGDPTPRPPDGAPAEPDGARLTRGQRFRRRYRGNRPAVVAAAFLVLVVVVAVAAPLLAPHDPEAIDATDALQGSSAEHLLGTDDLGRDVLSRLLFGARTSMVAALLAVAIAFVIGVPTGLLAGYAGGRRDQVLNKVSDTLMSLPPLIVALGVIAATGPGLVNAMVAIGIVFSPRMFRVVRGATFGVRTETFVEAAVSMGATAPRIIRRHILPNILAPLTVEISLLMAFALLAEASLSFLGLGVVPPDTSWGLMLGRAFRDIYTAPSLIYWPGLAIALTTISFNLVGDGIRDAMGREIRQGD